MTYAGSFDDDRLKNTKIAAAEHHANLRASNLRGAAVRGARHAATSRTTIAGSHGIRNTIAIGNEVPPRARGADAPAAM